MLVVLRNFIICFILVIALTISSAQAKSVEGKFQQTGKTYYEYDHHLSALKLKSGDVLLYDFRYVPNKSPGFNELDKKIEIYRATKGIFEPIKAPDGFMVNPKAVALQDGKVLLEPLAFHVT